MYKYISALYVYTDVSPSIMPADQICSSKEAAHAEHLENAAVASDASDGADEAARSRFREMERRCVRKLDLYIAPLMGAFNFIVSGDSSRRMVAASDMPVLHRPVEHRLRSNPGNDLRSQAARKPIQREPRPSTPARLPRRCASALTNTTQGHRLDILCLLCPVGGSRSRLLACLMMRLLFSEPGLALTTPPSFPFRCSPRDGASSACYPL